MRKIAAVEVAFAGEGEMNGVLRPRGIRHHRGLKEVAAHKVPKVDGVENGDHRWQVDRVGPSHYCPL